MRGITRHIRTGLLVLTVCVMALSHANAAFAREAKRILVITSYNPDTKRMYTTLSDIWQELNNKGENNIRLDIENLNCKGLSEGQEWKHRMADILNAHRLSPPDLIIPLGQEAWSSFLSQNSDIARRTPVMPAIVSTNTLICQDENCNIRTCHPKAVYYDEIQGFNIVGGVFYKYDIEKNLELTRQFFPNTKRIALITDFTLGGLAMQTHVIRHMERHKDIELLLLDGRRNTVFEICNKLKNLNGQNTVLWLGTWRIDSSENYSLTSTDDVLRKANPQIPAFSLSATGMGNWAIGGYTPEYTPQGKMLADMAIEYLYGKKTRESLFHIIPSTYTFDQKMLEAFNKEDAELPQDAVVLNTATHFFSANKSIILSTLAVFAFLAIALALAIYYLLKMKRLRDALEIQSEELKRAKDIAERANNVKTSFIANMSHELRTPLNAIVGFANLLEEDDYEEEEKKQFCHVIKENSDMLLNLISDILDISKIESGKLPISPEECDVIALCRTSILSVKHASKMEGVEYIEDFPSDESLMIYTDPMRLKQVVINLLSNASKYTKKGFIKLTIRPDYDTDYITFAVTDTGCGIPEDKAEMVFGRFVKLNQYVQGTGLGLPLCRVLTESMGGKIWLDTSYTNGTRMVFTHPLNLNKTSRGGVKMRKRKKALKYV